MPQCAEQSSSILQTITIMIIIVIPMIFDGYKVRRVVSLPQCMVSSYHVLTVSCHAPSNRLFPLGEQFYLNIMLNTAQSPSCFQSISLAAV